MPAEDPALESLLERMQADLHVRVLPQQDVVLEVDRDLTVQRHVQHRNQLTLEAVAQPGASPWVIEVGRMVGAAGIGISFVRCGVRDGS